MSNERESRDDQELPQAYLDTVSSQRVRNAAERCWTALEKVERGSLAERVTIRQAMAELVHETLQFVTRSEKAYSADLTLSAIDSEPDLPGSMPDAMWWAMNGDRDATEEAMRIAVRQTKQNIRERFLAAIGDPHVER